MPSVNPRTLIGRWFAGTLPKLWPDAHEYLKNKLRGLETVLRVVHGAVEHPAPTLVARQACTGNTAITATTDTAITGATITVTPDVDMLVLVIGQFDLGCTLFGAESHIFTGSLFVNGAAQSNVARANVTTTSSVRAVSQQWTLSLSAGTSYALALQGRTSNVGTNFQVNATNTGLVVAKFPNLYRVT